MKPKTNQFIRWAIGILIFIGAVYWLRLPWYIVIIAFLVYDIHTRLQSIEIFAKKIPTSSNPEGSEDQRSDKDCREDVENSPILGVKRIVNIVVMFDHVFDEFVRRKYGLLSGDDYEKEKILRLRHPEWIEFKIEYHPNDLIRIKRKVVTQDNKLLDISETDTFRDEAVIWAKSYTDYVPEDKLHEKEKAEKSLILDRYHSYLILKYEFGHLLFYGIEGRFGGEHEADTIVGVSLPDREPKQEFVFLDVDIFDRDKNESHTKHAKDSFKLYRDTLDFSGSEQFNLSPRYIMYSNQDQAAEQRLNSCGIGWQIQVYDLVKPEGADLALQRLKSRRSDPLSPKNEELEASSPNAHGNEPPYYPVADLPLEEREKWYKEQIHQRPDDPRLHNLYEGLAYVFLEKNEIDQSVSYFERALDKMGFNNIDTNSVVANLVDAYMKKGDAKKATALAEQALCESWRSSDDLYLKTSDLYLKSGNRQAAAKCLFDLSQRYLEDEKIDGTIQLLEKIKVLDPNSSYISELENKLYY